MKNFQTFKVGSRESLLAITQTNFVLQSIKDLHPEISFEIIPIVTTGDYRRDHLSLNVEDKKQWVIEIEKKLVAREIDFAIHSAKDVPLEIEPNTSILPVLRRKDPRDILFFKEPLNTFKDFEEGAVVGTSSKRRYAQLKRLRPDLKIIPFRGNINTRLQKLQDDTSLSGIILAKSGIERLNLSQPYQYIFTFEEMLPAIGQGQLLSQFLTKNDEVKTLLDTIVDHASQECYKTERALVRILEADCHSCLGVYCQTDGKSLNLISTVLSIDGTEVLTESGTSEFNSGEKLATTIGEKLLALGAKSLLKAGQ